LKKPNINAMNQPNIASLHTLRRYSKYFNMNFALRLTLLSLIGIFGFITNSNAQCAAGYTTTISGLGVLFTNQATGSYNYIEYDYGDGDFDANISSPAHTYDDPGIYIACQFIMDTMNFNCFDEYCDTLYLGGATCMAAFDPYLDGLDLEVYNESLGDYDSLWYDYGDGNGSNSANPTHSYSANGYYTICLSLYSNDTLCDSTCYEVYADDTPCDAAFSYSDDDLTVDFTDESTGNYNAVYWDFGDGFGTSEDFDPTYTYFTGGTYEVCLVMYDSVNFSCDDETCKFVTVEDGGGGGGGCDADYKYTENQLELTFTNLSTGGLINTWDFGDGSGIGFEENPVHTFAAPGTYEVCVTTLSPFPFCTDTYCEFIDVKEYTCEPTFTYSFNATNAYTFVNTTIIGNVTSVLWDFGDGNTSAFPQPSYTYNAPGTYNVCLITYDEGNECGKTCQSISVYPLSVETAVSSTDFKLIPNPNHGRFALKLPTQLESKTLEVRILDLGGRLVYSAQIEAENGRVPFRLNLATGAYIMQISGEDIPVVTKRVLIE